MKGGFATRLKRTNFSMLLTLSVVVEGMNGFAQDLPAGTGENRGLSYGLEADFNSGYVWRGIAFSNEPTMQPSVWVERSGLTFTVWRNVVLGQGPDVADLRETDLSLTYRRHWKRLTIEPALDAYLPRPSPGVHDPNTMEGSLKLSHPAGPLSIFTTHSFDVLAYRGAYFGEAGMSYDRHVNKKFGLNLSLRSGWASSKFNDAYIGLDKPAFDFVGAEVSLTYYLKSKVYIQPHIEFSDIVDHRLRPLLPWPTFVNFGLAMGVGF